MNLREIKFRGKRIGNGKFVFGDLIHGVNHKSGKIFILPVEGGTQSLSSGIDPIDGWEVIPETVGQFSGVLSMDNQEIYEGDEIVYREPYRATQTHTGDNIPNGSCIEPLEPDIKEIHATVVFESGMFTIDSDEYYPNPLSWIKTDWDLESIKEAISWRPQDADLFDDPEEGDLQYLIHEVAKVKNEEDLIDYLNVIEITGNIHDHD